MRNQARLSALPLFGLTFAPALASAAMLHVLDPHSDDAYDYAVGVADNGAVIGNAQDPWGSAPVVWSKGTDAYAPAFSPTLPGDAAGGELRWISPDASLLAGYAALSLTGSGENDHAPVVWSRSGPSASYAASVLPRLGSGASETLLTGGSANGSRFVGQSGLAPAAALWRGSPGSAYSVQALPLPGDAVGSSLATSLSSDGARAVGHYETAVGSQAVVWTENTGAYAVAKLQMLAGGTRGFAETISRDGSLAAGAAADSTRLRPVIWDTGTGAVTVLETLPGFEATVLAVAENKVWLGGRATDAGSYESGAVLWNADGKVFDLESLASAAGVVFTGLAPESVTGIHFVANGLYTIVGTGLDDAGLTRGFVLENFALATPSPEPGGEVPGDDEPSTGTPDDPVEPEAPATPGGVFIKRHPRSDDLSDHGRRTPADETGGSRRRRTR
jgi:uncharacterized membrane protein